jgi:hypothetical protein
MNDQRHRGFVGGLIEVRCCGSFKFPRHTNTPTVGVLTMQSYTQQLQKLDLLINNIPRDRVLERDELEKYVGASKMNWMRLLVLSGQLRELNLTVGRSGGGGKSPTEFLNLPLSRPFKAWCSPNVDVVEWIINERIVKPIMDEHQAGRVSVWAKGIGLTHEETRRLIAANRVRT